MSHTANEISALAQGLAAEIERRKSKGERHTPRPGLVPQPEASLQAAAQAPQAGASEPPAARQDTQRAASACQDLTALHQAVQACRACALGSSRARPALAAERPAGDSVDVLFLSDVPGQAEEASGKALDGEQGGLLDDIITKGMQLGPERVHITQLVKCRPPGDRAPSSAEKKTCSAFLERELELLSPKLVLALGARAAEHVLKVERIDPGARGKLHLVAGQKVIPTFHPSFLLKNPAKKRDCWQDIKSALSEL